MANIEKAFLNIEIAKSDRDILRLFWLENSFDKASRMKEPVWD